MTALRWTTWIMACAAIGGFAGLNADFARLDRVSHSFQLAPQPHTDAASPQSALQFVTHGHCQIPVLTESDTFQGGMTTGEQVTLALDTKARSFRFQIEAAWHAGQPARVRTGEVHFDEADCTYRLGDEETIQIAVNHEGVLFGSMDSAERNPVRIIAFRNVSRQMKDLAGTWRVIGDDGISASMQETQIRVDGTFSRCSLTHANPLECVPDTGRITRTSNAFQANERSGHGGILIVGKMGDATTPLLLRPDDPAQGMRLLVRQADAFSATGQAESSRRPPQQHIQVVAPLFHPK